MLCVYNCRRSLLWGLNRSVSNLPATLWNRKVHIVGGGDRGGKHGYVRSGGGFEQDMNDEHRVTHNILQSTARVNQGNPTLELYAGLALKRATRARYSSSNTELLKMADSPVRSLTTEATSDFSENLVFTDAATSYGAGGHYGKKWFTCQWWNTVKANPNLRIEWMELFPIVVAACLWGSAWSQQNVIFHTDNQQVVGAWNGSRKQCTLYESKLIEHLRLAVQQHRFQIYILLIRGCDNTIADGISRGKFDALPQDFDESPTPIPDEIIDKLVPCIAQNNVSSRKSDHGEPLKKRDVKRASAHKDANATKQSNETVKDDRKRNATKVRAEFSANSQTEKGEDVALAAENTDTSVVRKAKPNVEGTSTRVHSKRDIMGTIKTNAHEQVKECVKQNDNTNGKKKTKVAKEISKTRCKKSNKQLWDEIIKALSLSSRPTN